MEKQFNIIGSHGDPYTITIGIDTPMYASCTCPAGQKHTLCKHILELLANNPELNEILKAQDSYSKYEEYIKKTAESEQLKVEAAKAKKEFSKAFLR